MRITAESLAELTDAERASVLAGLSQDQALALLYDWDFWARENQLLPGGGEWDTWLLKAGRGFGKTRTGAEAARQLVQNMRYGRGALIAPTAADARDVMIEGESGILAVSPPWFRPRYEPSKRRLTWPNGAQAFAYSADEPERLRGPQHDWGWGDELCAWRYAQDAWDNYQFGLRLGHRPLTILTTTPKPIKTLREIMAQPGIVITHGSTRDNIRNLAPKFAQKLYLRYGGTRLGRQELDAEILDDNPNALWTRSLIDKGRVREAPELIRIMIGVDPAVTNNENSSETGIVVAGVAMRAGVKHAFVLNDRSGGMSAPQWGEAAVSAYRYFNADRVIGEVNNGGDLVEGNIRAFDQSVSYKAVRASRGKTRRAEPVAALYEQGRVHHVGAFPELEDQMCDWDPSLPDESQVSPDRMDALVWVLTELMIEDGGSGGYAGSLSRRVS
ncbi:MAG: terminase family protein [Oceanococcaceae bacterium]